MFQEECDCQKKEALFVYIKDGDTNKMFYMIELTNEGKVKEVELCRIWKRK